MRSPVIVEGYVTPDGTFVDVKIFPQVTQTFFLQGPVESFQMSVVIGSSDPAEAVNAGRLPEEFTELRSMVTLQHSEGEGRRSSGFLQKCQTAVRVDALRHLGERPPRVHIKQRVDIEALTGDGQDVNGIHLHQIAGGGGNRPLGRMTGLLPWAAAPEEAVTLQCSLHRTETDIDAVLLQEMVDDLTAPTMFLPAPQNSSDGIVCKLTGMVMWPAAFRGYVVFAHVHSLPDPPHDGGGFISQMTGDGTQAESLSDELHGFSPDPGKVRISGVGHVGHCAGGCCEAIEPLRLY